MHLADLDDVGDATALARQVAPGAQVIVDGGIVTKDEPRSDDDLPDADDYAEVDRLAAVAVRPGVTAVSLTPTVVDVTVDDPDEVLATARALVAVEPADPVTSIRVGPQKAADGTGDAADQDLASDADRLPVDGSPAMLDASIQVGTKLRGFLPASSEQFDTNQSVVATLSDAGQVPAFVEAVRPVLPDAPPVVESETELQAACRATWTAYAMAYRERHGAMPVRNAKVNANVKQLVKRLGVVEAPQVAGWFLRVNERMVVQGMHDLGLLLARCEAYRTQWATGRQMTATSAQQADQTQSNLSAAEEAKAILAQGRARNAG